MSDGASTGTPAEGAGESRSAEEIRAEIEHTREQLGDTVDALAEKTDVKSQARHRLESARGTVAENLGSARQTVAGKAGGFTSRAREATPDSAGAGARQVKATVARRPLPFAIAGAFAAGLILGWLVGRG